MKCVCVCVCVKGFRLGIVLVCMRGIVVWLVVELPRHFLFVQSVRPVGPQPRLAGGCGKHGWTAGGDVI